MHSKNLTNPTLSIITPVFNEEKNLPILYANLVETINKLCIAWEWVIIDDNSIDHTLEIIKDFSKKNPLITGIRLSRNFGSHKAIICGLEHVRGDCAIIMAADLQDPPEVIPLLFEKWKSGANIVWAVRKRREKIKSCELFFSLLYYWILRNIIQIQNIYPSGADFFLIDRRVIDAIVKFQEKNCSIYALVAWVGFKQDYIEYIKKARLHGQSGWSIKKRIILFIDTITAFSYLPLRLMSYIGIITAIIGFFYAIMVTLNAISGKPSEGWSSLMIVVLIIGGIQMVMLGVLGEYLWRTFDESRHRPQYVIEERIN